MTCLSLERYYKPNFHIFQKSSTLCMKGHKSKGGKMSQHYYILTAFNKMTNQIYSPSTALICQHYPTVRIKTDKESLQSDQVLFCYSNVKDKPSYFKNSVKLPINACDVVICTWITFCTKELKKS